MEVKQTFDYKAPLGTTADYISDCVKDIYNTYQMKDPENQNLIDKFNTLLAPWDGLDFLEQFPDPLKKPLEKARANILTLKTDFDHRPKSEKKPGNINVCNDEINTWLNRVTTDIETFQNSYIEFFEGTHMIEDHPACIEILPTSSSGTAFWLHEFGKKDQIPASRFVDSLMLYFTSDLNKGDHTFMGEDKKLAKDFLMKVCSIDQESKVVSVNSFAKFLSNQEKTKLKDEKCKLRATLEHALKNMSNMPNDSNAKATDPCSPPSSPGNRTAVNELFPVLGGSEVPSKEDFPADLNSWSVEDLQKWLSNKRLNPYMPAFREHEIDGKKFLTLTSDQLKDQFGVNNFWHLRQMLNLQSMQTPTRTHSASLTSRIAEKGTSPIDSAHQTKDDDVRDIEKNERDLEKNERDLEKNERDLEKKDQQDFKSDTSLVQRGHRFRTGQGVKQNHQEAFKLYEQAAKEGDPEGEAWVAFCLLMSEGGIKKNDEEALRLSKLGVEKGTPFAYHNLGLCYVEGRGVTKDIKEAFRLFSKAAELEDPYGQNGLGFCYQEGIGVEPNIQEAIRLYQLSANRGNPLAYENLGFCYTHGTGVERDLKTAFRHFQLAAEQGHSGAQNSLGSCYRNGLGVDQDLKEAARLYRLAAEQGNLASLNKLGACYRDGAGVDKDEKEAVRLFQLAAEQGHATGRYNLGFCYQFGLGVAADVKKAVHLYQLAAQAQDITALHSLGVCYQLGIGLEKNEKEALRYYQAAAKRGFTVALFSLGLCYSHGSGIEKDDKMAFQYFREAAEKGLADAQYHVGLCLQHGIGVELHEREAIRYFHLAAKQNHPAALNSLGSFYQSGRGGVEKDAKKAYDLYRLAAEAGNPDARNNLAFCYENGIEVEKDEKEALKWYRMAADQGHPSSLVRLGQFYEKGRNVEKDLDQALTFYELAAKQGDENAKQKVSSLEKRIKLKDALPSWFPNVF